MAHNITRIEGFEGGETVGSTSLFLDVVTGTPEVIAAAVRSGDYGLRIVAPAGAGLEAASLAFAYNVAIGTAAADLATDIDASICRFYVRPIALPGSGTFTAELFALQDSSGSNVVQGDIDDSGRISLDANIGTTQLAIGTWYRFEIKSDGFSGVELWIGGVLEVSSTTAALANRLSLGKSSLAGGTGGYTVHFDDVEIESSDDVANIDFPGPGRILRMDVDGDGFFDANWTSTTDPNAYLSVMVPDNGDTDRILSPEAPATGNQTCTLEATSSPAIGTPIHALQYSAIVKRTLATTLTSFGLMMRSGVTNTNHSASAGTLSYLPYATVQPNSPFTLSAWTLAELDGLQVGLRVFIIV